MHNDRTIRLLQVSLALFISQIDSPVSSLTCNVFTLARWAAPSNHPLHQDPPELTRSNRNPGDRAPPVRILPFHRVIPALPAHDPPARQDRGVLPLVPANRAVPVTLLCH